MPFPTSASRARLDRGRFAWLGLAAVLAFLTAFSLWIALTSNAAGDSARKASLVLDAYERARYAVATEESLERKYRLEPGPEVRTRFDAAAAALVGALEDVRAEGDGEEATLVADVLQLHGTYLLALDRMFAAVDEGQLDAVLRIDIDEVDPVFGQIETAVTVAAKRHRDSAAANLASLGETDTLILAATPIVFVLGIALLLLSRRAWRGFERRLEDGALRELADARAGRERALALAQIATTLGHLQAGETPEIAGQAIAEALLGLEGIDSPTVLAFDESGIAVVLGRGGDRVGPVDVGGRLPATRSAYLLERARAGAWTERWVPGLEDGEHGRRFVATGLIATAYAPIPGEEGPIGLLAAGTFDEAHADRLADHLPALVEFAPSARLLLEKPLQSRLELRRSNTRIQSIIARGAFHPVFQPIVELTTRTPVGYEALTRFDDGTRPDLVFAEARRCGLEHDLEAVTLRAALTASDSLPAGPFLSVNASPGFILGGETLQSILAARTRPIVVEVTEHDTIDDYAALRTAFVALGAGLRLAVDDAGAGVANFSHLVELRPQLVKVDIGLVRGVNADLTRQALIVALLHFAGATDCQVVAEGIETEAERAVLEKLEIQLGQGYLFGRPAEAASWALPTAGSIPHRSTLRSIAGGRQPGRPGAIPGP